MGLHTSVRHFAPLEGHGYMSLVTFRKNGQPVPTPVWFAAAAESLYVTTIDTAGKVKRIRANAQVEVAPCTVSGQVVGDLREGMARILPAAEAQPAQRALARKYGIVFWVFIGLRRLQGKRFVYLEITPM